MNETPLIRLAEERDVPRIVELYRELTISNSAIEHTRNPTLADYQLVFAEIRADRRRKLFVIEILGEVVGTIELFIIPNLSHNGTSWAFLENLIVTEKHRRRGLGRMLLEYAVELARKSGCHMVELCSDVRRNEAHKLYGSMGFELQAHCFRLYF
ncbi:MAG: GNAT family N-acetyltransferase [Dehalococcoidia bacterium]|nr:GNAT family N-acetyltransferase [Dehalococcoidia bacterium]